MGKESKIQILRRNFGTIYNFFKVLEQIPSSQYEQKLINHYLKENAREILHNLDDTILIINKIPIEAITEVEETPEVVTTPKIDDNAENKSEV